MSASSNDSVEVHGFALRLIRQRSDVGQDDLAAAAHVSNTYISHIEAGRRRTCSRQVYMAILHRLGIAEYRTLLAYPHEPARPTEATQPTEAAAS